jgi:hypothetical protein
MRCGRAACRIALLAARPINVLPRRLAQNFMRRCSCTRAAKVVPAGSKMHGANWQMQAKHPVGRGLMRMGTLLRATHLRIAMWRTTTPRDS